MLAETFIILTVMFIAVMGPSVVISVLGYAVVKALSRNPSASPKIFMGMAIMIIFAEALSIVAMIIIYSMLGK